MVGFGHAKILDAIFSGQSLLLLLLLSTLPVRHWKAYTEGSLAWPDCYFFFLCGAEKISAPTQKIAVWPCETTQKAVV